MRRLPTLAALLLAPVATFYAADKPAAKPPPPPARPALPENVEKREVTIFSDGVRMTGDLYLPKGLGPDEKRPVIVICAGTAGLKSTTGRQVGPVFAQNGYVVLAFNYRGWGQSDSKLITLEKQPRPNEQGEVEVKARAVRWQMDFADQVMDIRAAISFVGGEPNVDPGRLAIWGTSYGGGLATWTAGNDPRVKCTVVQVPGMGGGRGPQAIARSFELLTKQSRGETEPVPYETGKFGGLMSVYGQMRQNPAKAIGYSAFDAAEKIKTPMFILDAASDELMKIADNGQRVADILKKNGTPVEYHVMEGMGHYGVYKERFKEVTAMELTWLNKLLKPRGEDQAVKGLAQESGEGLKHQPLDPTCNPYWQEYINRDRLYDFYARQAIQFGRLAPTQRPAVLPQFPGLDGVTATHFGNQTDADWRDDRANHADIGSMMTGSFHGADRVLARGVSVSLGDGFNAVYNLYSQRFVLAWKGDLVKWSDYRHGVTTGLVMGGQETAPLTNSSPATEARYLGLYRNGRRVVFAYELNGQKLFKTAVVEDGKVVEKLLPEAEATQPGEAQWPQRIKTHGTLGDHHPYAIDTLTLPYDNPWHALLFLGGVDFVSPTRIAVCTLFGDVWICDVSDDKLTELTWKRYATGLYEPLGLKVINGVIHVMCRDQIVALHDLNGDDEADFYECVENVHETVAAGHQFNTGLERDDHGRFYFSSATQGVCRVEPDGKTLKVLGSNLRNPDGIAINPDGSVVLASVQEGNYTPASAICDIVEGGHYGFGGPGLGEPGYVTPMVYLPRGEDSSSGGDTYIDSARWGPEQGNWIHFSYSMNRHFLVLREVINGKSQAAAIPLWGEFISGSHRGRLSPYDGQLYVAGTRGYLNYGIKDGALQRVRRTGGAYHYPSHYETRDNGILLTFDEPQPDDLANAGLWFAQQWNYRFSLQYGSDEYSVKSPGQVGHDPLEIRSVRRLNGGRQVFIEIPQLQPGQQLHLYYQGSAASERLEVFATIHNLGRPFTDFSGYVQVKKDDLPAEALTANLQPAPLISACTACHHPTLKLVGPSFADIRKIYANNPEGIVKWAMNPVKKTPNAPPMPSFYFAGEEKLRVIANEILSGKADTLPQGPTASPSPARTP